MTALGKALVTPNPEFGYRQGVVVAYDLDTGENQVDVGGAVHSNLPVLGVTDSLALEPGMSVGVLRWQSQFWITGRIALPGSDAFGQLIVRSGDGDLVRLGRGEIEFAREFPEELTPGRIGADVFGATGIALLLTAPHSVGSFFDNRVLISGATSTDTGAIEIVGQGHAFLISDDGLALLRGQTDSKIEAMTGAGIVQGVSSVLINASAGSVFIDGAGAVTGSVVIACASNNVFLDHNTTGSPANCRIETTGQILRVTSSQRFKEDIRDLEITADQVLRLRPRTWIDPRCPAVARPGAPAEPAAADEPATRHVGFIAEELDGAGLGLWVEYDEQGRPDSIAYDRLAAALTVVVQQQRRELDNVRQRLTDIETRLAALEGA